MTEPKNEESKMRCPEDAEELYQATKDVDPFPHIPPALLNSADIHDYIETTGMVYPYDPKFLKSSSYEAQIGERAIYWDEKGEKKTVPLTATSTVKLEPNSLVFFETKQEFRLPPYMAIRFNLRITNVHKGLLLGTGPLVDPGFCGKLLIPIHNLTNNIYTFLGDEKFIWVEFTKVSPHADWDKGTTRIEAQSGIYETFPENKKWRTSDQYFVNAYNGDPIRNAVPAALEEARERAKSAEESAEKSDATVRNYGKLFTVSGAVAILAAAAGIYFGVSPLITGSTSLSKDVSSTISEFRKEYSEHLAKEHSLETKIEALGEQISSIKLGDNTRDKIAGQQNQLDVLKKQVDVLQNELNHYKALLTPPNPPIQ